MANELRNKLTALTRDAFAYFSALAITAVITAAIYGTRYIFGDTVHEALILLILVFNVVIFVWNVIHSGFKWSLWYTIVVRLRDRVTGDEEKS